MKRELLTLYNIVNMFDEELNYTLDDLDLPGVTEDQIKNAWGLFLDVFYEQTIGYVEDEDIEDFYEDDSVLYERVEQGKSILGSYSYTIRTNLDPVLQNYCDNKGITISIEGPYVTFTGAKEVLEALHNDFFYEYTFDLQET